MAKYDRNIASRLMADLVRDYAITQTQAAAIVGNLAHESAGFKQLQEISPLVKGSKGGFGFAQWTGPRRRSFEKWSKDNGLDIRSYEANYGYLKHEIDTDPYEGKQFWEFVEKSRGKPLNEATKLFSDKFLRPGIPHMNSRVAMAEDVATVEPVERMELAALPAPSERPSLADQLGYEPGGILAPETAGSFAPISTAAASEMPDGGLLPTAQPTSMLDTKGGMPALLDIVENTAPERSYQERPITEPTYMDSPAPNVLEPQQPAQPQAKTIPLTPDAGLLAAAEQANIRERQAEIAASPESMLPEELLMSQPIAPTSMLSTPAPVAPAPVTTPVQAPSMLPAPQDPYSLQQSYTPSPTPPTPSAMDVWNGKETYGVDNTGQYELNRADNGNIYRYSSKYDRTDILNPDGSYRGQKSGKIDGPADSSINLPSFGNPFGKASTKNGAMVRGVLGSTLGGALGGMAGPVGSLAGSLVGRNLAQGQGLLSLQGAASKMTPGHYGPITANTYPDAPNSAGFLSSRRSLNNSSLYDPNAGGLSAAEEAARRNSISPAAAAHVARGGGSLF